MMSWCPTSSLNLMPWLLGRLPTNWRRDAEKREKLQNNRVAQSYPWTSLWHIDMKTNDSTRSSDDCEEWTKKDKHSLSNNLHKCKTARVRQYVYTVHWGNHLAFLLILCCTCGEAEGVAEKLVAPGASKFRWNKQTQTQQIILCRIL